MDDHTSNPRPLHIGWRLDAVSVPPAKEPVYLKSSGLKAHTAIIAQSGSGKSFMLGRMLEEIALKTEARIVVLDPNADFIRCSEVNHNAWHTDYLKPWFADNDTYDSFERQWRNTVGILLITSRTDTDLNLSHPHARVVQPGLRWDQLTMLEQAHYLLGLSREQQPEAVWAIERIRERVGINIVNRAQDAKKQWDSLHRGGAGFGTAGDQLLRDIDRGAYGPWSGSLEEFLQAAGSVLGAHADQHSALYSMMARIHGLAYSLSQGVIWDKLEVDECLPSQVRNFMDGQSRLMVIDLPSLSRTEEQMHVTNALLDTVWNTARERWAKAITSPQEVDNRYPIFIVVDEAHNLAPIETTRIGTRSVTEHLERIATEGRKYGLFLVLVTQRPSRLHHGILSQCDNLCLMKMNNRIDLKTVEETFGFLLSAEADRALKFKVGDALLSGNFVKESVAIHGAPRRTHEGGRNLEDTHWLRDPRAFG